MAKSDNTNMNTDSREKKSGKLSLVLWIIALAVVIAGSVFLHRLSISDDGRLFPVYISEVLAANTVYPNEDGRCCDFIEIYNSADYPFDLSGFQLGDIAGGLRYAFPYGTVIEPGAYYVVYCDETTEDDTYAPFAISRSGGESFYLIASNNAIVDSMTTMATEPNQSMVLTNNNEWAVSFDVTPGRENSAQLGANKDIYNAGLSAVRISEFSSANTAYVGEYGLRCDWVELHNTGSVEADISGFTLSDNVGNDKYIFPEGTVLAPDGYLVVNCSDRIHKTGVAPFGLSPSGDETIVLKNAQSMIVEIVDTLPMTKGSVILDAAGQWSLTDEITPGFDNTADGYAAYLRAAGAEPGSVLISEVMAGTQLLLTNCYGELSDWVELYNCSDRAVDLSGWYLSDDPTDPMRWEIPALEIGPGERAVVFCSGRDTAADGELHTNFSLSAGGESLMLSSSAGLPVTSVSFGKSENNCSYVFDEAETDGLMTNLPTPGFANDEDGYEQYCDAAVPSGALAIWEVMSANDWYLPQALGECYDWVELRNISNESINLAQYSLTDEVDSKERYVLPDKTLAPGASIVIILSGNTGLSKQYAHADFALNAMEDQLYLFEGDRLSDCVYIKNIPLGCSYGRSSERGGFFYMEPTPERENNSGFRQISQMPNSEYAPGVYTGDSNFEVPLEAAGAIYYTLDGSEPNRGDKLYTEPITITETAVLRAISVEEGKQSSDIYTATFVIGEHHDLPVVSLVTDPDNLWGPNGIYKYGDMSIKEERRPGNVAFSGEDGSFSLDCELNLHGATTVTTFKKKSFTVRFLDNYDGPLDFDVFKDGEVTDFRSLILRASHESTYSTHMRDSLLAHVASRNSDTMLSQKYRYVAMYLNGEYWGLYAFREHHSEEHFASYMNVPASSVTSIVRYCTSEVNSLRTLYKMCEKNGLRSEQDFAFAKTVLDMSSIVDWIIYESYVGNLDVFANIRYYYCEEDGLWRLGLSDVDLGMFSGVAFDEIANTLSHGVLVTALLQNDEFQDMIATRLAELLSGPMSDEAMIANIDEIADIIRSEIPMDCERWGGNLYTWELLVDELRDYCDGRAKKMINSLCIQAQLTAAEKEAYFGTLLQAQ